MYIHVLCMCYITFMYIHVHVVHTCTCTPISIMQVQHIQMGRKRERGEREGEGGEREGEGGERAGDKGKGNMKCISQHVLLYVYAALCVHTLPYSNMTCMYIPLMGFRCGYSSLLKRLALIAHIQRNLSTLVSALGKYVPSDEQKSIVITQTSIKLLHCSVREVRCVEVE